MADEKPSNKPPLPYPLGPSREGAKTDVESFAKSMRELAERDKDIRKWMDDYAKQGDQVLKWISDLGKLSEPMKAALAVFDSDFQKKASVITESMKQLDEAIRLTKEGKLGAYSDETPIPELMQRMKRLKEAQKKALETGQVDLAAANEWLLNRWPEHRSCPLCNHEEWRIGPSFAQIPTSTLGLQTPPRINPCVAVVCGHCGNTVLLNALIMGLLPEEK